MGPILTYDDADCLPPEVLPVKTQCLPYAQIPHTTRLFTDFLSSSPKVHQFYPRSSNFSEWLTQETPGPRYDARRRSQVSDILERLNRGWDVSEKTIANIARLRAGAFAAVTGQQVGLFGGPVFSL